MGYLEMAYGIISITGMVLVLRLYGDIAVSIPLTPIVEEKWN